MTSELTLSATRIRPRLTGPASQSRSQAKLRLTPQAAAGLAAVSKGRPLEELVGLTAAVSVVLGRAEQTDESVMVVAGPAGPVVAAVPYLAGATVAGLIRAVDSGLRAARQLTGTSGEHVAACWVGSDRVGARSVIGEPGKGAIELRLTDPATTNDRELVAEADPSIIESWFADVLLRSVVAVLGGFNDVLGSVADLSTADPRDASMVKGFGEHSFEPDAAPTTLTTPIAAVVRECSDRIAVVAGTETLTYGDFSRATEALVLRLRAAAIGRGDRVAVLTGKSLYAVPAIVAVLQTGAAYVPLDPRSPATRLAEILDDADCAAVLTTQDLFSLLPADLSIPVIDVSLAATTGAVGTEPSPTGPAPGDLAYVVYTSGSTGRPKGVQVSHGAVASYVRWKIRNHDLGPETRVLQLPSLAFDSSVADLFPVLAVGGRLVLADAHLLRPRQLASLISQHGITHVMCVPSLYRVLLEELPGVAATLRVVTVAGEAMPADLVRRHHELLGEVRLVNEYGPTENSVGATAFDHSVETGPGLPIGRPISNTIVTVTDSLGRALPPGFIGEISLAGHGLAEGYRNDPEQTADSFVADCSVPGGRLYRTGDLAWWRPDGMLEFAGRADTQVKVRGHRVELSEVERALAGIPGVRQAVVTVVDGRDGAPALAAWLEAAGTSSDGIRAQAAVALPPAMIPTYVTLLDQLPRLVSGKIDREALTRLADVRPTDAGVEGRPRGSDALPDADEIEAGVAGIFQELLECGPLGPDSEFFDEGGHSLLAIAVLDTIEERMAVSLDLDDFFSRSTVREVATMVREAEGAPGR